MSWRRLQIGQKQEKPVPDERRRDDRAGAVALDDKYVLERGRAFMTGTQALVRLPMLQRTRDAAAGLNTAGYVSGYRGSPLGGYDVALERAAQHLKRHHIVFQPGLNEDLAATALWGTQQVNLTQDAKYDGVFGIWYGKGPGVARSMDVFKHVNLAGCSQHGGVLAVAGDDHANRSSSIPHQSDLDFISAMIPILSPTGPQEILDLGLFGFALSRFSSCWVGLKVVVESVESAASVEIDSARPAFQIPEDYVPPAEGLGIRRPDDGVAQEIRLHGAKMAAVQAFARANAVDHLVFDAPGAQLGIAASGKAYLDVRQALDELGIDEARSEVLGIRLYKIGLVWPLEKTRALAFAAGLDEILVVEEKRAVIEEQLATLLFLQERRPRLLGKLGANGEPLFPSYGELSPTEIARVIVDRLRALGRADPAPAMDAVDSASDLPAAAQTTIVRTPFFCSGCPHNTSTQVPEGSRALAGIGCHSMAIWMPQPRAEAFTHMGGEGLNWVGQAPFTRTPHMFQNLGDGTYSHSGLLAIRAAAASGVNITYKILYNDAVAMTGGQPLEGALTVPQIARQVAAEGAKRIVVMSDEPDKYEEAAFAKNVDIHHRDDLDEVQRSLRETPGLTVLIYDQTCAAEKRRRRKRGLYPDPAKRVFINELVCEGCGDCSVQSNCISVQPLETEFGRKRTIDQSSCNKDFSCLKGFCPSFVTVYAGRPRKPSAAGASATTPTDLPTPLLCTTLDKPYGILITGIGGTGVITIGQILGMAAHIEGKGCSVLDVTGLAQKNGAVTSHVRIGAHQGDLQAVRIAARGSDLLLACDAVVAASEPVLRTVKPGATRAVINADISPVAAFVSNGEIDFEAALIKRAISERIGAGQASFIHATKQATSLFGDSIATNLYMLGFALQKGLIPLSCGAVEAAVRVNGGAVEKNLQVLAWGRFAAIDSATVERAAFPAGDGVQDAPRTFAELVDRRAGFLAEYQDESYANRYRDVVQKALAAENAQTPGQSGFAEAVARGLFKLMTYKDEYEVARLYTDSRFAKNLARQFEGELKLEFSLAPPLFARRDPITGHQRKQTFGSWILTAFELLAALRRLRGTRFDIFGYTQERRAEREAIKDFIALIDEIAASLSPESHMIAVQLAALPLEIKGFGHIQARNRLAAKEKEVELRLKLHEYASDSRANNIRGLPNAG
jgi:indolepyruvate ferredoxin oxidoreductase